MDITEQKRKNSTKPLFSNAVAAKDPRYNYLCSDSGQNARMFTESLWQKYQPFADRNFREQIRREFDARFWEMYLACTLMDKGYEITRKSSKNAGPDIKVAHKGKVIWVEAVAPTSGNQVSSDKVPELIITNPPTAQQVPDKQMILRYRAAIKEKYDDKYFSYLNKGLIKKEDFYIIAINGCRIPHSGAERELPRILRSVMPFGPQVINIDTRSGQRSPASYQYSPSITKVSGSQIQTDIFLDQHYRQISAVHISE